MSSPVDTPVKESGQRRNGHPPASTWQIIALPVERIEPSPYQPRLSFDVQEMSELVASVRAKGVQQPIIVRTYKSDQAITKNGDASQNGKANRSNGKRQGKVSTQVLRYELIAGERRLRACKEAGRRTIPAIIRDDLSDAECAELALLENVQRSNLSVIEEALGYKRLMVQFRMKEERIAKKVGKSVATIRDMLRLLQLPEPVQRLLGEKKLTASHGQELLQLAAFERICVLVAEHAAQEHLTATSLQTTPLPNVVALKRSGLVTELDWRTKFDWQSECANCPHKAYVRSGYASYCLKPDEWKKKQEAAIEQQKEEASRVLAEARRESEGTVEVSHLPPGSYRNLSYSTPPVGCSAHCPCRSEAADPADPTKRIPICLDPNRYNDLVQAEREAQQEARRHRYLTLWQSARDSLRSDVESHNLSRIVALLALPVLQADFCRYIDPEKWRELTRSVSESVGVPLSWDELLQQAEEGSNLYRLLQETEPEHLLLLCACLLLAHEADQAVHFAGETPQLDFVLGHTQVVQPELEHDLEETS